MKRERAFTQVQLEYERLRGDRPDLSHKELWHQAEDIAASNPTAFAEEERDSAEYMGERPPRWPLLLIGISGALIGPLLLIGVFLSFGSIMEVGSSGSVSSQTQAFLAIIGWLLLFAWIGVLVGIGAVAATDRSARFGAFVGAAGWVIVTLFVWSLSLG